VLGEIVMKKFARIEKHGRVAFVEGKTILHVPTVEQCREKLISLLEAAGGDRQHQTILDWWLERAKDISGDDMRAAWAAESFELLNKVWDELVTPPQAEPAEDVFASFGM
jgi:hypothetical protein